MQAAKSHKASSLDLQPLQQDWKENQKGKREKTRGLRWKQFDR